MNKAKIYLSRALRLLLLLLGVVGIYMVLDYAISDDTESQTRVAFHDFYEADQVDYLFVGTSHTEYGINSCKMSECLNAECYTLGSSSQDFQSAYWLIKEAVESKQISHLYYELSFSRMVVEEPNETKTFIISDYIRSLANKVAMITDTFDSEHYVNGFLRLRRNFDISNLYLSTIKETLKAKGTEEYQKYLGTENYVGRGQWISKDSMAPEGTLALNLDSKFLDDYTMDEVQARELEYLQKIIDLCRENDVDLNFYMMPYSEVYIMNCSEYESLVQVLYDIAEENNIPLMDFNCIRNDVLQLDCSSFFNVDHVTYETSEQLAEVFAACIQDPSGDWFTDSLEEKYPHSDDVRALGFELQHFKKNGKEIKSKDSWSKSATIKVTISAFGYQEIPVEVRLWKLTKTEEGWMEVGEIEGIKQDACRTSFSLPYDGMKTRYKAQLLDPETGEVLYETTTQFEMT